MKKTSGLCVCSTKAAIPAIVLLSKADLLAEEDLHRVTGYIQEQLQAELGLGDERASGKLAARTTPPCSTNSSSRNCFPDSTRREISETPRLPERSEPRVAH